VPLAKDLFLARDLQLNGAVRRTQYERSSSGSSSSVDATTWKVGGTWTPLDWVRLRATKSRDIRAPNVAELYGPTTAGFAILNDPARGGAQTNPATLSGANPNLNPEVADTETYGIVFQPQLEGALGRVQLSVDYFEILMSGAIGTLGSQTIVTRCFQGATEFCSLITRDAANGNVITLVKDVALNVNKQITRGVDVEVGYKQPLGAAGDLDLRLLANFVADLKTIDTAGVTERAGQTGMRGGVNPGMPDYTLDAMVTWKRGPAQATLHGRYIPDGLYNPLFVGPENPTFSNNLGNSTNTNAVPSALYLDLSGQYAVASFGNGSLTVYGAINNLTDKDAPRIPGTNGSGNNVLFDVTGRAYKLGMRYKF
jgi:outer membrane receptor protein involved in Fe transport